MDWLAKIVGLFSDPSVDEVCLNGTRSLVILSSGRMILASPLLQDSIQFLRALQEFALAEGQRLDPLCPSAGGSLRDGLFRWHCVISPAVRDVAVFSLRRQRFEKLTMDDFSFEKGLRAQIEEIFSEKENHVLFCGPTASGKSSLLATCLKTFTWQERVAIIEELEEIPLLSPYWIALTARKGDRENQGHIKMSFLVEECLRLRPDRIVVGEVRTIDALIFFETMLLGHLGSLTTIHADGPKSLHRRVDALFLFRKRSPKSFRELFSNVPKIWCVYMRRSFPPTVVSVERFELI